MPGLANRSESTRTQADSPPELGGHSATSQRPVGLGSHSRQSPYKKRKYLSGTGTSIRPVIIDGGQDQAIVRADDCIGSRRGEHRHGSHTRRAGREIPGGPGQLPAQGSHRPVHTRFTHTVPQVTVSLLDGRSSGRRSPGQRDPFQEPIEALPGQGAYARRRGILVRSKGW